MTKRTFTVNIAFKFELDVDEMKEWKNKNWGYNQCPLDEITEQKVHEELHTCLSHEFAQDEAGLCSLPNNFKLEVTEITKWEEQRKKDAEHEAWLATDPFS